MMGRHKKKLDLPSLEEINKELAQRKLSEYFKQAWPIVEPTTELLWNWHHDCICEYLQCVDNGQISRLIINIPPRYSKSSLTSIYWPTYSWIKNPGLKWLFASYSQSLSNKHSRDRRLILQSEWYQKRWGKICNISADQNMKMEFTNTAQGAMIATSLGGSATGKGADRIIMDDAHNVKEGESDLVRESVIYNFDNVFSTRLNNKKTGAIIVIMQRIHEEDLTGHLLEQGGWEHLKLPAECSERTIISCPSGKSWTREPNTLLWEAREGPKEIAQAKKQLRHGYSGQYQQDPSPSGGEIFKREWFRYYKLSGGVYVCNNGSKIIKQTECTRVAVMDCASSEEQTADYTVIQAWDIGPNYEMILIDQFRDKVQSPVAIETAVRLVRRWNVDFIAVETNGIGLGIYQSLLSKRLSVKPIRAKGDKKMRATVSAQARMESGTIYLPERADYLIDLEHELLNFPKGRNDDMVDTLSHTANIVNQMSGGFITQDDVEYMENKQKEEAEIKSLEAQENLDEFGRERRTTPEQRQERGQEKWLSINNPAIWSDMD